MKGRQESAEGLSTVRFLLKAVPEAGMTQALGAGKRSEPKGPFEIDTSGQRSVSHSHSPGAREGNKFLPAMGVSALRQI